MNRADSLRIKSCQNVNDGFVREIFVAGRENEFI